MLAVFSVAKLLTATKWMISVTFGHS